jgi:ParB family chromosome partitioning protein
MNDEYEFHELANLFPMLGEDEANQLEEDIKAKGLLDPIILFEGKILDGRNRYTTCRRAGVEPTFTYFSGEDPLEFVVSRNISRRHLTVSQRAMIAGKIANMKKGNPAFVKHSPGTNAEYQAFGENQSISQVQATKILGVCRSSIQHGRKVLNSGIPELQEAVKQGEVTVSKAAEIADLPEDEQQAFLNQAYDIEEEPARNPGRKRKPNLIKIHTQAVAAINKWRTKFEKSLSIKTLNEIAVEMLKPYDSPFGDTNEPDPAQEQEDA